MGKKNVHVLLDERLADAIQRYADEHGTTFTAALSVLATRALRDENRQRDPGITPGMERN